MFDKYGDMGVVEMMIVQKTNEEREKKKSGKANIR